MGFIPSLSNKTMRHKGIYRGSCVCEQMKLPFGKDERMNNIKRGKGIAAETASSLIRQLDRPKKLSRNQSLKWLKESSKKKII